MFFSRISKPITARKKMPIVVNNPRAARFISISNFCEETQSASNPPMNTASGANTGRT
jgi:hypothetical protein